MRMRPQHPVLIEDRQAALSLQQHPLDHEHHVRPACIVLIEGERDGPLVKPRAGDALPIFRDLLAVAKNDGVLADQVDAADVAVEVDADERPIQPGGDLLDVGETCRCRDGLGRSNFPVVGEARPQNRHGRAWIEAIGRIDRRDMERAARKGWGEGVGLDHERYSRTLTCARRAARVARRCCSRSSWRASGSWITIMPFLTLTRHRIQPAPLSGAFDSIAVLDAELGEVARTADETLVLVQELARAIVERRRIMRADVGEIAVYTVSPRRTTKTSKIRSCRARTRIPSRRRRGRHSNGPSTAPGSGARGRSRQSVGSGLLSASATVRTLVLWSATPGGPRASAGRSHGRRPSYAAISVLRISARPAKVGSPGAPTRSHAVSSSAVVTSICLKLFRAAASCIRS